MITLKWSKFPESVIASYNVYRSIIGFEAPLVDLTGKTLTLRLNGGAPQTITFTNAPVVDQLNAFLSGGKAFLSDDGLNFFIRSCIRQSPGSVEIVDGTAMSLLGLSPKIISEKSDAVKIANVPMTGPSETFQDNDGVLQDWYAVSSVTPTGIESLKTPWQQPIQSAGPICVVEGVITDLQGVRIPDCEVTAVVEVPPTSLAMAYITKEPISTLSATDGRFSLPILQGALVKLEIPKIGYSQMVTIPNLPYIFIKDLRVDEDYNYPAGVLGTP